MKFMLISLGRAVVIPEHLKEESEKRFPEHQFNIIASDMMSLNRSMPDVRYPEYENFLVSIASISFSSI